MQRLMIEFDLLGGGLFVCERCGSNLLGMRKTANASYYICGSQPHRRGMGCGTAVYVPQVEVESEVMVGLTSLLDVCADANGFTRKVNEELRRIWQDSTGYDPTIPHKLRDIEAKIANIRKAVEDGLPDGEWAYSRMRELMVERDALSQQVMVTGEAPQIDVKTAMAYRVQADKIMMAGSYVEKKRLLSAWIDKIQLAPETLEVDIRYKIPEPVVDRVGAGARFEAFNKQLLSRTAMLPLLYCAGTRNRQPVCVARK